MPPDISHKSKVYLQQLVQNDLARIRSATLAHIRSATLARSLKALDTFVGVRWTHSLIVKV